MPNTIEWRDNNVIITFTGTIKLEDILDVNEQLYGDSRFDDIDYQISDFRQVEDIEMEETDVFVIASLDKASSNWNPEMKLANITSNEKGKEMIKQYAEIVEGTGWQVRIFENMEEAINWCNE